MEVDQELTKRLRAVAQTFMDHAGIDAVDGPPRRGFSFVRLNGTKDTEDYKAILIGTANTEQWPVESKRFSVRGRYQSYEELEPAVLAELTKLTDGVRSVVWRCQPTAERDRGFLKSYMRLATFPQPVAVLPEEVE